MSKIEMITKALTRTAGRTGLVVKKYSPEILMVTGVISVVGSTVMACRATLKLDEVLENSSETIEKIEATRDNEKITNYSEEDAAKDVALVKVQTGVAIAKLYAPAAILMVTGVGCMLGAHGIMRKRNLALIAAYKAVEDGFAKYRKRVVAELGEEKDREFKTGVKYVTQDKEVIDENGNVTYKEEKVKVVDEDGVSIYARYYDKNCLQWSPSASYNAHFIKNVQRFANDMLDSKGHVFLNEVYDMLGIERCPEGAVTGWVRGQGDGYIEFGIDFESPEYEEACKGEVLLDFNVDGIIYDLI